MSSEVEILVQIGADEALAGRLWAHRHGNVESATFRYDLDYLGRSNAYALDPGLPLDESPQQTQEGRKMFGAFSDCAPDRWGRRLIKREEGLAAKDQDRTERSFGEIDYLLGVRDDLRQGALRFRDPVNGNFLADNEDGVPLLVDLPRLLNAAEKEEGEGAGREDIRLLLRGGSSLGGARPKAHVKRPDGRVAIAKFPSPSNDEWNVILWEGVALSLARKAGLEVPDSKLEKIAGRDVLIVDRFDRERSQRIGYVSAMTMLEMTDGDQGNYLDIAEVISDSSPDVTSDLRQLWRRIAFSVLISNTDDHLRNHGFLRTSTSGWSLSPAFDLNPNPEPGAKFLQTGIDFDSNEARLDILLESSEYFDLTSDQARSVLHDVSEATSTWRREAEMAGLTSPAIEQMAPAFEHEQARIARS
jgi:serine/threonine-protein kinase HipA